MQEKISPAGNFFAARGARGIRGCGEVPVQPGLDARERPAKSRLDAQRRPTEVDRRRRWP